MVADNMVTNTYVNIWKLAKKPLEKYLSFTKHTSVFTVNALTYTV